MRMKKVNYWIADNKIGDEGTKSLSEMLKINTTLISLKLQCGYDERKKESKEMITELQTMRLGTKGQKQ